MNEKNTTRRRLILAGAAIAALMIAAPIRAHEPKRHHRGHEHQQKHWKHGRHRSDHADVHVHRHGYYRPRYAPAPVLVVPRRIAVRETARYRPYLYGSVWHADHRHAHAVYHFPVSTEYGIVYRPHVYCEGELFLGGSVGYRDGHVSFSIRF